jgi:hypothetical protein
VLFSQPVNRILRNQENKELKRIIIIIIIIIIINFKKSLGRVRST